MTYEEAHAYLENQQREFTTHRWAYADDLIEANGTAILALEKQIPKKPLSKIEDADTRPNCKEFILLDDWGSNYCKHCGQAIYWRVGKQ